MDVKFSSKSLVAIEYPGVVLNTDVMTKTLGGESEMRSAFNNPNKRLELKFRPDDPYCKCAHGDRVKTNNLLLKVTKRTKKPSRNGNASKEFQPEFKIEFLGVTSVTYKFKTMVDFQVLPITFDKHQNKYKSLIPDVVPTKLLPLSWLDENIELFVPPLMYSRFDTPQNGFLETNRPQISNELVPENVIGKCRKRRAGFAIFVAIENDEIPYEPQEIAMKQLQAYPLDVELKVKLEELFNERPIWSRNALAYRLNLDRTRFKYSLPCVAYYFTSGPWRTLWIKFGFDPRKDPSSKHLQTMDVRLNNTTVESKVPSRTKHFAYVNKSAMQQRTQVMTTDLLLPPSVEENGINNEELKTKQLLCQYIPGELPPARQCFYQLCDIHLESVQTLVHQNDGREEICHEKDGWCELNVIERGRELIIADINKTLQLREKELDKCND